MNFKDTGLPPGTEEAYAYFLDKTDQKIQGTGFLPDMKLAREIYGHFGYFRLQLRAAVIMGEMGVDTDLISAFLIDSARYEAPRADSEGAQIQQKFGNVVFTHWQAISDPALHLPKDANTEQANAHVAKLDRASKPYKTAQLAFYAARVETLLGYEGDLLSKTRNPVPDRKFVDGVMSLSEHFSSAHLALERRLEKDCERLDRILTRLGHPSARMDLL